MQLGGDYAYFEDPPPSRPKGMRQRTYARLLSRLKAAEELHDRIRVRGHHDHVIICFQRPM